VPYEQPRRPTTSGPTLAPRQADPLQPNRPSCGTQPANIRQTARRHDTLTNTETTKHEAPATDDHRDGRLTLPIDRNGLHIRAVSVCVSSSFSWYTANLRVESLASTRRSWPSWSRKGTQVRTVPFDRLVNSMAPNNPIGLRDLAAADHRFSAGRPGAISRWFSILSPASETANFRRRPIRMQAGELRYVTEGSMALLSQTAIQDHRRPQDGPLGPPASDVSNCAPPHVELECIAAQLLRLHADLLAGMCGA